MEKRRDVPHFTQGWVDDLSTCMVIGNHLHVSASNRTNTLILGNAARGDLLSDDAKHASSKPAQALLFLPTWRLNDAQKAKNQRLIRQHVMKNVIRARRTIVDEAEAPLLDSWQSQLPLLPFAHLPISMRFYIPAFVDNCK
jgi:hypothetical protein